MNTEIKAPMTGKIISIVVHIGDQVKEEDEVIIMDAMKMEIPVYARPTAWSKTSRSKKATLSKPIRF